MTIQVKTRCHMGPEFKCEEIVDGEIVRCKQYIELRGTDAQGKAHDKFDCSFAWVPILMLESARHNVNNTAAIDKLHNSMVTRQREAIKLVAEQNPSRLMDK